MQMMEFREPKRMPKIGGSVLNREQIAFVNWMTPFDGIVGK